MHWDLRDGHGRKLQEIGKILSSAVPRESNYREHPTTNNPEFNSLVSAKENEFLQKMKTFIEDHMSDAQFNMNMLCHHMAMSHPQLHRKITALTGESTGSFVRHIRLTKARDLLLNSGLTISEIAYEVGFSDPGYFTKVFSKAYTMSPTEYRAHPK